MPKQVGDRPQYLVVNADKIRASGTCKDREVMRHDPHLLVEGCLIAGCAMAANTALHLHPRRVRARAREPAGGDRPGLRGQADRQENIHGFDWSGAPHGAGAPCGEETALLENAWKASMPRLKPPFPANMGLYGCRSFETIAQVPDIMRRGAAWFANRTIRLHLLHLRPRGATLQCRGDDGHPAARADRAACRLAACAAAGTI